MTAVKKVLLNMAHVTISSKGVVYYLTSIWVLPAPESWLKYCFGCFQTFSSLSLSFNRLFNLKLLAAQGPTLK